MVTVGQHIYNTIILLIYKFLIVNLPPSINIHPEQGLTIQEQITKHGYPLEEHIVQTKDGYILSLFRIPRSPNHSNDNENYKRAENSNKIDFDGNSTIRLPVLVMHGFLSSAQDFIVNGPNMSIPYQLVEKGYDVWLGNSRGNTYARKHVEFHPDEARFWQFSYHEIGCYDLPATINYIINYTNHKSIYYIGHSQGATAMLVMASEKPKFIKKIKLFVGLAPVAFSGKMPGLFPLVFATFYNFVEWIVYAFEYVELFPHSGFLPEIFQIVCQKENPYYRLCQAMIISNFGYSPDVDDKGLSALVTCIPAGASTRQLLHFLQNIISDSFSKFDHGEQTNLKLYGQIKPPKYNVQTKLPTALFYSDNDLLSTVDDVERISAQLKNLKLKFKMPGPYSHGDYLIGINATKIVVDVISKLFKEN